MSKHSLQLNESIVLFDAVGASTNAYGAPAGYVVLKRYQNPSTVSYSVYYFDYKKNAVDNFTTYRGCEYVDALRDYASRYEELQPTLEITNGKKTGHTN